MLLKRKPKKKTITKAGPSGISVIIPRISQRLVEISLSMQSRNGVFGNLQGEIPDSGLITADPNDPRNVPLQMIVFVLN
jgi:hypothetical protein